MADEKAQAMAKPEAKPDEKAATKAAETARQHKVDRLKRAIAPLEQATANAHDQAGAGHAIASTVTEAVVKAAHEMVLAAKAVLNDD